MWTTCRIHGRTTRGASTRRRGPAYPAEFKKLFEGPDAPRGGYMWIPPREPALLDYKDALFILIGRSPNLGLFLCSCHPSIHEPGRAAQCCP